MSIYEVLISKGIDDHPLAAYTVLDSTEGNVITKVRDAYFPDWGIDIDSDYYNFYKHDGSILYISINTLYISISVANDLQERFSDL